MAVGSRSSISSANAPDDQNVYRFDAGPQDSPVADNAHPLHRNSDYSIETGFGWTRRPTGVFTRPGLSRSRSVTTIDGVVGAHLAWRVAVAPGDWLMTLWLEAEHNESRTVQVLAQGRELPLNWQIFSPRSEPQQKAPRTYRVLHARVSADSAGLRVKLIGRDQDVRLLGIELIRRTTDLGPAHDRFLLQVQSAGDLHSKESLAKLSQQADQALSDDRDDACYALWQRRLDLLGEAERLLAMRGWEWARDETGLGMFDRLYQAVMLVDGSLGSDGDNTSLLADRATYLRGRILYWLHRQGAGKNEFAAARRDLNDLHARYPDDKILAMYVGQKVDLPDPCDDLTAPADAPAWSVAQREALCRMRAIAHWWVNEQQAENGEFGGKLGDDVELLRWWAPLVLSGDRTALAGWQKLADGVWQSPLVHDGYATKVSDVEHAAEFIADTAPLMAIVSDDPRYQQRLTWSAKHFDRLWTDVTPRGHRFFRSAWFSSTAIETDEPKGRDLEYNTRAVQPLRYLVWRRDDPHLVKLLHQWSSAWVDVALRTDKGKPRGIMPASVRFVDEAINGDEPTWYLPNMYWKYFQWQHHAGSLLLDQLLFTYALTNDDQLLKPMRLSLDLIRAEVPGDDQPDAAQPGSPAWAAVQLVRSRLFWQVVQQWRFTTDDSPWDDLILRHGTPYGRYRISGDERHLVAGLNELLDGVRYNTPLKTTEALHTDRVYVPRAELLKAMLTGDGVQYNVSPYFAVTWEETDAAFTALVNDTGTDRLTVKLYSHTVDERRVVMRLWQLAPGDYALRRATEGQSPGDNAVASDSISVQHKGQRVPLLLPGHQEITVTISRNREQPAH